jgi:hypothetical protein
MPTAESSAGKKVGIMISASPGSRSFEQGLAAADRSLREGAQVYLYLIDNGVEGLGDGRFAKLKKCGAHLFACAYSLQRRGLQGPPEATLAGLTILSDVIASADVFESFN